MYKIIGADGKEYGPISLELLQRWQAEGRINSRTRILGPGATEWKNAAEFPELAFEEAERIAVAAAAAQAAAAVGGQRKGLAIASFVLGLLSLVLCFAAPVTAIPAIILGHIAHVKSRRARDVYGGGGLAIAGFVLGYVSLLLWVGEIWAYRYTRSAFRQMPNTTKSIVCINNMKQIGVAFKVWALDHNDQFPFNVSTNAGGTMEFCRLNSQGFDQNAAVHFAVLSNELSMTMVLICPAETNLQAAVNFTTLLPSNVSYQVRSGTNVSDANPQQILAICPIHGHVLRCDGSVKPNTKAKKRN